jgi:lipopolysaccharide/colanic/teichoic acid biosynthesis glycosyltransferase
MALEAEMSRSINRPLSGKINHQTAATGALTSFRQHLMQTPAYAKRLFDIILYSPVIILLLLIHILTWLLIFIPIAARNLWGWRK